MKHPKLSARSARQASLATLLGLSAIAAGANQITGEDTFVCTAWRAVSCSTETDCENSEAWRLNIPDFVRVDLSAKEMSTLRGADEARTTAVDGVVRSDGRIFLSGAQEDRAFSWVINEETGEGTMSIVSDTTAIALFTVCAATNDLR